jgi:raffinose/stachyose/melibiose transport system substrate-binding protein
MRMTYIGKWLAAACLLAAAAITSCGRESTGDIGEKISPTDGITGHITVVTNRTDMIDSYYTEYAKRFHEKYPGATVSFETFRDYDRNTKIRLATGEIPDVLLIPTIPNSDLPKFFAPLGDLGFEGELYFQSFKEYGGQLYGVPAGVAVTGVLYNKTSFRQAGIQEVPQTLDAFFETCRRLKAAGIVPLASNFKDRWPLQVWSNDVPILLSGTAAVKNAMAATDTPFQLDSPYGASMSIIKSLYEQGFLEGNLNDTNWESSKRDVAKGQTAMMVSGNWTVNQLIENGADPDNIGFFPFPADNSGKLRVTLYPDRYYAIGKNSKHPEAARAFVKWIVEESGYEEYSGFIPVLKNRKPRLPQLLELDSYKPEYVEFIRDTDALNLIQNKVQLEMPSVVQEFILEDPGEVFDKYNKQWAQARRTLNISP